MTVAIMKEVSELDIYKQIQLYNALKKNIKSQEKQLENQKFSPKFTLRVGTFKTINVSAVVSAKENSIFWTYHIIHFGI